MSHLPWHILYRNDSPLEYGKETAQSLGLSEALVLSLPEDAVYRQEALGYKGGTDAQRVPLSLPPRPPVQGT